MKADLRLVDQGQLVLLNGGAKGIFQEQAALNGCGHFSTIKMEAVPAVFFASYMAVSACLSTSSTVLPSLGKLTIPILVPLTTFC